jgi:hypothetical protein
MNAGLAEEKGGMYSAMKRFLPLIAVVTIFAGLFAYFTDWKETFRSRPQTMHQIGFRVDHGGNVYCPGTLVSDENLKEATCMERDKIDDGEKAVEKRTSGR